MYEPAALAALRDLVGGLEAALDGRSVGEGACHQHAIFGQIFGKMLLVFGCIGTDL